jgi:acetylornithine deacetylase/succinyl-diaminopimelate desuccinylase-like protein
MTLQSLQFELDLLQKLVEIDTTVTSDSRTGYVECSELIRLEAQRLGLGTEILDGRSVTVDGEPRPNVVVSLDGSSDVNILLLTHMDVVPAAPSQWKTYPFQLVVKGDRAYGRGAADCKSNIAAALGAMRELVKEEPEVNLKLIVTVDEEIGGRAGIEYLFDDVGLGGTAAVVLDSAPNYISIGASGALWGRLLIKGVSGHSGYPEKADNAIYLTTKYVEKLKRYHRIVARKRSKLRGPPGAPYSRVHGRFTVTMIQAWKKENIIPGECEIRFDRRLIPEEDTEEAQQDLWQYMDELAKTQEISVDEFEIINTLNGYYTDAKHPFVRLFSKLAGNVVGEKLPVAADLGGNDGGVLAEAGLPVVSYGTIRDDTQYHSKDEFVYLKDIQTVRDVVAALGRSPAAKFSSK